MRRVWVVVVAVAMMMVIPAAAQAMKPEQFEFDGATAIASWAEVGEDTAKFTDAFLNESELTVGGDTFEDVFFDIFVFEFEDDGFVDLSGFAALAPDEYSLDAAGGTFSASVEVDVELFGQECTFGPAPFPDCEPLGPFLVTVAIEWDETTGRIFPSTVRGTQHSPFGFSTFRQRSQVRATSATGAITGDLSVDLGITDSASVGRNSFADRFRFTAG